MKTLNDQLDFKLKDCGSFYTLEAQTEEAREFMAAEGISTLRYSHDNWLHVAVELNKHGYSVKVD